MRPAIILFAQPVAGQVKTRLEATPERQRRSSCPAFVLDMLDGADPEPLRTSSCVHTTTDAWRRAQVTPGGRAWEIWD
jgi:hypothetical protein